MPNDDQSPAVDIPFNVGSDGFEDDDADENLEFGNDFDPEKEPEAEEPEAEEKDEPTSDEDEKADDSDAPAPEAEEEESEEAEEPAPEKEKPQHIPKSRFDAVNERRKQAEREAEELRRQVEELKLPQRKVAEVTPPPPTFDFDAKEQEYMEAIVDGDFDLARKIRGEIRVAERAEFEALAVEKAERTTNATKQRSDFEAAVAEAESTYSVLKPGSDDFDSVLVDEVVDLANGWVASGKYAPGDAMRKAVKTVAKVYDLDGPAPEEKPDTSLRKKEVSKAEVRKKTTAAASTPPDLTKAGEGVAAEVGLRIDDLSEEEFDALPESKLRELRGDYFGPR